MQYPAMQLLNEKSGDPFPCVKELYELYANKGVRTVFFSVGASPSCVADLEIAEMVGCPINILCSNEADSKAWFEVKERLRSHKEGEELGFSTGAASKWVLPKNVKVFPELEAGTIFGTVQNACKSMLISEDNTRIDILKVDLHGGERAVLYEILDSGFRPATIIVRWSYAPDSSHPTKLVAGHLQNCGYALIGKEGNKYLYYYVDNDMYSTCSWENVGAVNPMVDGVVAEVLAQQKLAAEAEAAAEATSNPRDDDHVLAAAKTLVSDMGLLIGTASVPLASTLAVAKALGLPEPPGGTYTNILFHVWITKIFDRLDKMTLADEARKVRKELIVLLKGLETRLDEAASPSVFDSNISATVHAC
jgi:hypothetical protein